MKRARSVQLGAPFFARLPNGAVVHITHAAEVFDESSGQWIRETHCPTAAAAANYCRDVTAKRPAPGSVPVPGPLDRIISLDPNKLTPNVRDAIGRILETIATPCGDPNCEIHGGSADDPEGKPPIEN